MAIDLEDWKASLPLALVVEPGQSQRQAYLPVVLELQ